MRRTLSLVVCSCQFLISTPKNKGNPNAPAGIVVVESPEPKSDHTGPAAKESRPYFPGSWGWENTKLGIGY